MKATFKLNKRCKNVDKYDEVDAEGNVIKDNGKSSPLLGTVYIDQVVAKGRSTLTITVED